MPLLRKPSVRRTLISEEQAARLFEKAGELLRPSILIAYDRGMRRTEILRLCWDQVVEDEDVKDAVAQLEAGAAAELGRVLDTGGGAATTNDEAPPA